MGEEAKATQQALRRALRTTHTWQADDIDYTMTVRTIRITSQPVGAMFDYLLNEKGEMLAQRRMAFKGEIGILGLGMNTVELLVVRNGSPVQRFTAGRKLGVRRLLELINHDRTYSLAEVDARLRRGSLDIARALPAWQSEVLGFHRDAVGHLLQAIRCSRGGWRRCEPSPRCAHAAIQGPHTCRAVSVPSSPRIPSSPPLAASSSTP